MLTEYGITTVGPDWELDEDKATGFARIYYVHEGIVTYESSEGTRTLLPGRMYVLPSSLPYRVSRDRSRDFRCTYMHLIFTEAHIAGLIELDVPEGGALFNFIKTAESAMLENCSDLLDALADCVKVFISRDPAYQTSSSMVSTVRKYVLEHMSEEVQLQELSDLFSYHPNYFIRLFYKETGVTPHRFIIQLRMQYAALLINRGMSSQDAGYACGYTDASIFTRAFRNYYGVTPFKYRHGSRKP